MPSEHQHEWRIVPRHWAHDSKILRYQTEASYQRLRGGYPPEHYRHEIRDVTEWREIDEHPEA